MSNWKQGIYCCIIRLACAAAAAVPAVAAEGAPRAVAIGEREIVARLVANNPDLESLRLSTERARQRVLTEEGRFPYYLQADAGYTRSRVPALAGSNEVLVSTRDSFAVATELRRVFPTGTQASLRVQGERFSSSRATTGSLITSQQSGVGYQATARATVIQPLLRGAGRSVNEVELRASRLSQAASLQVYESRISALLYDALTAYWELWYASRAAEIERSALELAEAQLEEARQRAALGALAAADVLQFETRVAELRESVVAAEFSETQQWLELRTLVGESAQDAAPWRAADLAPPPAGKVAAAAVLGQVVTASPEVLQLEAELKVLRERAEWAGDELGARLDVQGWVEAAGLGAGTPVPVARQLGGLDAVSVYGGVVYETPLDSRRQRATRAQANLEIRIAEQNLRAVRQRLQNQAAQLVAQLERTRVGLIAAQETEAIAERQVVLERQRFRLGGATPLEVQQAEETLRLVHLRVARARVNAVLVMLGLEHLTGRLLARYTAA